MWIAGVDEAGRGPIAGPVVAACVVLPPRHTLAGIADSKQLTPAQREALYDAITRHALAWAIGLASPREIERYNILQASLLAMRRAVLALPLIPQQVLVDGKHAIPNLPLPQQAVVGGDALEESISAAMTSVLPHRLPHASTRTGARLLKNACCPRCGRHPENTAITPPADSVSRNRCRQP